MNAFKALFIAIFPRKPEVGQKWMSDQGRNPFDKEAGWWRVEILDIQNGFVKYQRELPEGDRGIASSRVDEFRNVYDERVK